jgi:hypothetical protein
VRPLGPDTGAEDHHRALLHAQRQVDPGQGHRARRPGWTKRPTATVCRAAHPRGRPGKAPEQADPKKEQARENAREEALKKLEEQSRKPLAERKPPEYGTDKDFPLTQALNRLKGQPVLVSKTQVERKEAPKEN